MLRVIRNSFGLLSLASFIALTATSAAHAQTLGDVITRTSHSFINFPNVLAVFAYMSGLFFAVSGIFKFKDHVDSPSQHPLSAGVKRFLAGGAMLTTPYLSGVLVETLFGAGYRPFTITGHGATGVTGTGMDAMIVALVSNVAAPMGVLLNVFSYLAAIILLLVGIHRLTKTAQEGPRGPAGLGTIFTFLVSGALFSAGEMIGSFSSSLFGTASVTTNAAIAPTVIANAAERARVESVIEAVMTFVMIVGGIAFIRGLFVLRAFADGGSQQATVAQALTFLFGGAVAINLGPFVNALQNTVGISGVTFS